MKNQPNKEFLQKVFSELTNSQSNRFQLLDWVVGKTGYYLNKKK